MSTATQTQTLPAISPLPAKRAQRAASIQPAAETIEPDPIFTREEIRRFRADDGAAMGTIAKIMTTLFTYTVIIMTVVILWTFGVVY